MSRTISLLFLSLFLFSCSSNSSRDVKEEPSYDVAWYNPNLSFEERLDLLVAEMTTEEKISQLTFYVKDGI
jgi:hypothetical protein